MWSFADPERPVLVERELLTSIPDLSAVTGIDVRRTPWLFGKALSVLDGRMMAHVVREPGHHHGRFALNLIDLCGVRPYPAALVRTGSRSLGRWA